MYMLDSTAKIDRIIDTIRIVFAVLGTSIILIKYGIQSKNIIEIINDLIAIRESLLEIDEKTNLKTITMSNKVKKICFLNFSTWSFLLYMSELDGSYKYFISYMAKYDAEIIISCIIIQCSVVLKLSEELFMSINRKCFQISENFLNTNKIYCTDRKK